ncbi:MAG: gluconolaconase [Sphingobacteriales bacterium]|nr:MAG: gluconolaconase [Sphingobacteriales bacterium]
MRTIKTVIYSSLLLLGSCIAQKPTERVEFNAVNFYPEGVVYHPGTNAYYIASERLGSIGKVTPDGKYTELYADKNMKSAYGIKVHPDGKSLYVCVSDANYSIYSTPDTKKKMIRLVGIDIATGKKTMDVDLSGLVPGEHFGNDLTFDGDNNAYITDSYADVIYKVTPSGQASVFSQNKMFKTEGISLNGIVFHPGGYLLVASTGAGALYKVDIKQPEDVKKVKISQLLLGADGLLLNDASHITVVINGGSGKIMKFETMDDWGSAKLNATTLLSDRFTYPTTATKNGEDVWVVNAKSNELNDSTAFPSKYFAIQKAVMKPIPKKLAE